MTGVWVQFVPLDAETVAVLDRAAGVLYVREGASEVEIGQAVRDHLADRYPHPRPPCDTSE